MTIFISMNKPIFPQRFTLVTFTFFISVLMYVDRACIGAAKGSVSEELKNCIDYEAEPVGLRQFQRS